MTRSRPILLLALAALAAAPAMARADGLPVGNLDVGPAGVTTPGGTDRFITLDAGRDTLVARVRRAGGQVLASRVLRGSLAVPAVALDGAAGGLAADGRTLVVIQPRSSFPRRTTRFVVLGARRLAVRDQVRLHGDYSFDAISPDGRTMYLVHYESPTDPTRYEVRGFDLRRGRLEPGAVVDPREPDEQMHGLPVTRAMSGDGRWAYTLYDGSEHPFIHALDTAGGTARCIDLDALTGNADLYTMRLGPARGGAALAVSLGGEPVALVDRTTFRVSEPAAPRPAKARAAGDDAAPPWAAIGVAAALALALAAGITRTARRRGGPGASRGAAASPPATARRSPRARWRAPGRRA
jgi:hypothetical protein